MVEHSGPLWEGSGQLRLLHCSSTLLFTGTGSHKLVAPVAPTSLMLIVARSSKIRSKLQCREQCKNSAQGAGADAVGALPKGPLFSAAPAGAAGGAGAGASPNGP